MCQEMVKLLQQVYFADMLAGKLSKMCQQCFRMVSHTRIAFGTAQNGNTSATKIMGQEIMKLLQQVYFADVLAGNLSKMRRQCFRMFAHLRIASGTAQNGNTSATKIVGQEIVKLLPEVYFATMLAGNLSKMHRQSFRMFSHLRIASGTAQNGNTSANKIMGQEIVKLLPKKQYIGHKNNVSRNCEIAAESVFYNNAGWKLIQNLSAVFQNVFPLPDCVGHGPKCQYIGHKNNVSRDREISAGSVFCNNACRRFIQNASAVLQNVFPLPDCIGHGPE